MEAPPTPPPPAGRWTRRRAKCRFYNDSSHKYVQLSLTRREGRGRDAVGGCFETGRDDGKMIYGMIYGTFSAFPFLIRENIPLSLCNVPQKSTTTSYPHTQTRARSSPLTSPDLPSVTCLSSLSTVLGATVTNQCDHLSAVRALEDSFDICTICVGKAEPKHVQVVLWVFRNAEARAFFEVNKV